MSTWDGYYCSELLNRRRLQELSEDHPLVEKRLLQSSTYQVVVFYGVNTKTTSDTSQATVNAAANTTSLLSTSISI